VLLSSSSNYVILPGKVTVPAGKNTVGFGAITNPVPGDWLPAIRAYDHDGSAITIMKILSPKLSQITLSANSMTGGEDLFVNVYVNSPAPAGGTKVALRSTSPAFLVPTFITIPQGSNAATLDLYSTAVTQDTTAKVSASLGTSTIAVTTAILAPRVSRVSLSPTWVRGSATASGTVSLNAPAPTGGELIKLASDNPLVTVPASVKIAAGVASATFTATATGTPANTNVTITATDPYAGAATGSLLLESNLTQIVSLPVAEIAYDKTHDKIWVSTDTTGPYANSIVSVDPQTGAIGQSISFGVTLGRLTISEDGHYAFVYCADGSIRRADLTLGTVDQVYNLGFTSCFDLQAVPGSPGSFLVATNPLYGVNVSVWDGATRRSGTGAGGSSVRFAGTSSLMYGDGNGTLFVDTLSSTKITWTKQLNLNVAGFTYYNGLLYTALGTVVDPLKQITTQPIAQTDFLSDRGVEVNESDNRIYFVTWSDSINKRILSFDLQNYQEIPYRDIGTLGGGCQHLLACGHHTVAFFTFGDGLPQNLILIHGLQ